MEQEGVVKNESTLVTGGDRNLSLNAEYHSTLLKETTLVDQPHLLNVDQDEAEDEVKMVNINSLGGNESIEDVDEHKIITSGLLKALSARLTYLQESNQRTDSLCEATFNLPSSAAETKYSGENIITLNDNYELVMVRGAVYYLPIGSDKTQFEIVEEQALARFYQELSALLQLSTDGGVKSYCYRRSKLLEQKFDLYTTLNEYSEQKISKKVPHRDFYNVYKVDTHVHLASCATQKQLLKFIKKKLYEDSDEKVLMRDDTLFDLKGVFESLKLTAHDLSVDFLDMHVDNSTFHRFDRFNLKYNPIGEARLREIFLKTSNYIQGRYFAELAIEVIRKLEKAKYTCAEYRISVYGLHQNEFNLLAQWYSRHPALQKRTNVMYMIQVPRLYANYYAAGKLASFDQMLYNVFAPVYEASLFPGNNPALTQFLSHIGGFDSVDDESKSETYTFDYTQITADRWARSVNPPYSYYLYHMYANVKAINIIRRRNKMNLFSLRPHCGESGSIDHLASAFLTSESISHGIVLKKSPVLEYLYYLAQVGLAMSPLSNNYLFLTIHRNPLLSYFKKGLNVSLSTDDPLQFHLTNQALLEEFSVVAAIHKLSSTSLCELAYNSVSQSSFPDATKTQWLGKDRDITKTNIPSLRTNYRNYTRTEEFSKLNLLQN